MCGIAGIINGSAGQTEELIHRMTDAIWYRGPDDSGYLIDDKVALGHRRLSIIDLENGHQPMFNTDKNIAVIFNGEIYNYRYLRSQLIKDGFQFKTNCDTEVLVFLYEKYGKDFITKLNGMFALCIYDMRNGKILLARDRMGQKPLFYFRNQKQLFFCSVSARFKRTPRTCRENIIIRLFTTISHCSTSQVLTLHIKGFLSLPPAHFMEFDIASGDMKVESYWEVDFSPRAKTTKLSFNNAKMQLRELLTNAVKRRLMSDVPYGAFLSGGLDSSIITGIMMQLCEHPV